MVHDRDLLLSGVASTSEVIVLDGERDGIEQVSAVLAERHDLDAVHVLTHGSERLVKLGGTWLSQETLNGHADQIAGWSLALAEGADVLFYACNLASGEEGRDLLASLHRLIGADIAASSDDTGHAQYGADWILEYQLGTVETDPLLSPLVQAAWDGLLATVTVTNSTDVVNGNTGSIALLNANTGGDGISLREAVIAANNTAGTDSIVFNIFIIEGGLFYTIALGGQLDITGPVIIDGYTQPGASANSLAVGNNAVLPIELNGAGIFPEGAPPLINLTAGGSTIKGLVINRAPGSGIVLSGGDNNIIQGNFIGTDLGGTVDFGNAGAGIAIAGSSIGNTIGGSSPGARNLISGNNQQGIDLAGGTSGNIIRGNYIGTNKGGTGALANSFEGVRIMGSSNSNTIGGSGTGDRNVISGNLTDGVRINGSTGNLIQGNYIGTTAAGTAALGNTNYGVLLQGGASGNTVGGLTSTPGTGAGNVLSGNGIDGVAMEHSGTASNLVQGNVIGLNAAGAASLGIQDFGVVLVDGPTNNTIGGTAAGARNIISGNEFDGVLIVRNTTAVSGTVVEGNYIGTDLGGTLDVGNGRYGVLLSGGATNNRIGGTAAASKNVIAGNTQEGVRIESATSTGNLVQGNYIGANAAGTGALGNGGMGVLILTATGNTIGGGSAGARNIISGNAGQGLLLTGGASSNAVQGNYIGTNAAGTGFLSNGFDGVVLSNAANNTIGGTTAGERNIISGNNSYGVTLADSGTTGNTVSGNYIGTNAAGTGAVGNGLGGVRVSLGASANTIQTNRLAFNGQDGVSVESGTGNRIQANEIFSNGGLGLDLGDNGVTANDSGDGDSGPNRLQNYPVLGSAVVNGTQVTIQGTLNSTANSTFVVEFFASPAADSPSGFGEGQTFLGSATVNTDGSGNATINSIVTASGISGQFISATATHQSNNETSEFALSIQASTPPAIDLDASGAGTGFATTWTQDAGPKLLGDTDATITDPDSANLASLTVTLTNRPDGAAESLAANTSGTSITASPYNSGTGVLLLSGSASVAQYQQVLRTVTYNNTSNTPNTTARTVTFVASDGVNNSNQAVTTLTIVAANDPPVNQVPGAQSTNEDQARVFSSGNGNRMTTSDADAGSATVQVVLTATNGTITVPQAPDTGTLSGNGTAVVTMTGSVAEINAAMNGLSFLPTANFNGTATLQIATNDQGNSGTGGPKSDTDQVSITVNAVNDAPVNSVPGTQSTPEDTAKVFSSGNGNLISISDLDAGTGTVQVTLTGTNGTITVPTIPSAGTRTGNGAAVVTLTGSVAAINTALNGLSFTPTQDFNGTAGLQVVTNDQGNSGSGGALSDTDSISITVTAVTDAPVAVNDGTPTPLGVVEDTPTVLNVVANDTDVDGPFPLKPVNVSDPPHGTVVVNADGTITYTPDLNYTGSDSFTYQAQDGGGMTSQNTATVSLTVTAVNDAPVITSNGGGATASISLPENTTTVTTLISTDIDGGVPGYTIVGGADQGRFSLTSTTGVLTFLALPDFEAPTDADANNVYEVTVQVSDGAGGRDQQALSITVTNVANTMTVTTTADVVDGVTSSIEALNAAPGADGLISLREAILAANNSPNGVTPDLIAFTIAGAGVRTIQPTSALPTLTDPVIIDATTQPGYSGTPLIELNGQSAGATVSGLTLTAGGSTVRGLALNRYSGAGVFIQGQDRNLLEGNVIGTSPDALSGLGNGGPGVLIIDSADNIIGGLVSGTGNILSGNSGAGLELVGTLTTGTQVWGNFIGTNATGASGIPNGGAGVLVRGAVNSTIGHPTTPAGVNRIAFNTGAGVAIESGMQHRIQNNAILANGGPAIDLNNDGETPNDATDADNGANTLQNTPTLTSAWLDGTVLKGTLTSTPNRTFSVEFARQIDGQLLGRRSLTTDGTGAATFELNLGTPVALGELVTATATDVLGNTSEYAPSVPVTADGVATFPLSVRTNGTGQGSVRALPAGIDLDAGSATQRYPRNTLVTLQAQPKPGFVFAGWSGFGVRETSPLLTVPIERARIYTATFVPENSTERALPTVRFLIAKSHWANTVTLAWERLQPPPGVTLLGYNIYREDPSGNLQLIQQVGPGGTSTTLTNIDQYESSTYALAGVTTRPDNPNETMETGFSNATAAAPGSGLDGWSILDEGTDPPPLPARSSWQTSVMLQSGGGPPDVSYKQLSLIGSPTDQTAFRRGTSLFRTDGINQGKTNFTLEIDLQSSDSGALGVLFRYINSKNYYRLSMERDPNRDGNLSDAYVRLIKVEGGIPSVVREALGSDAAYEVGAKYHASISGTTPEITVQVINPSGLSLIGGTWTVTDETFTSNGIGLYSSRNPGSIFTLVALSQDNPDPNIVDLQVDTTGTGQGRVRSSVDGFVASLDTQGAPAAQFDKGARVTLTATPDPGYGFGGWYDLNGNQIPSDSNNPNQLTVTVDEATQIEARFTGTPPPSHTLDINGDGVITAATDGRLAQRFLGGVPDSQLTSGLLTTQATTPLRPTAAAARSYMATSTLTMLDVDGDGKLNPFTDGRLVFRFLQQRELNQTGPDADTALIQGAIGANAQRRDAATIRAFLSRYLTPATQTADAGLSAQETALHPQLVAVSPQLPALENSSLALEPSAISSQSSALEAPLVSESPAFSAPPSSFSVFDASPITDHASRISESSVISDQSSVSSSSASTIPGSLLGTHHSSLDSALSSASAAPLAPAASFDSTPVTDHGSRVTVPMGFSSLSLNLSLNLTPSASDDQPLMSVAPAWLGDFVVSSAVLTEDPNRDVEVVLT